MVGLRDEVRDTFLQKVVDVPILAQVLGHIVTVGVGRRVGRSLGAGTVDRLRVGVAKLEMSD